MTSVCVLVIIYILLLVFFSGCFALLDVNGFLSHFLLRCVLLFAFIFTYNISLTSAISATRYYFCIFAVTVTFPYSMFPSLMLCVLWNTVLELNIKASAFL
jgi:hypothetical protein